MRDEIVVVLDDPLSSEAALSWAAERATNVGAVLRAVHVLGWPRALGVAEFPAPSDFMDVSREEVEDSYRQAITAVFDAVSPPADWILQFASGDPGWVFVQQSKDAHLLVVGTREHVGLRRLTSGSVSHYALHHAVYPVVTVPAPDAASPDTTAGRDQGFRHAAPAAERSSGADKLLTSIAAQLIVPPQLEILSKAEPGGPVVSHPHRLHWGSWTQSVPAA